MYHFSDRIIMYSVEGYENNAQNKMKIWNLPNDVIEGIKMWIQLIQTLKQLHQYNLTSTKITCSCMFDSSHFIENLFIGEGEIISH